MIKVNNFQKWMFEQNYTRENLVWSLNGNICTGKNLLDKLIEFDKLGIPRYSYLMYEQDLPDDISKESYSSWFLESKVIDGIRMGPVLEFPKDENY
jgi:hypothetical protein